MRDGTVEMDEENMGFKSLGTWMRPPESLYVSDNYEVLSSSEGLSVQHSDAEMCFYDGMWHTHAYTSI